MTSDHTDMPELSQLEQMINSRNADADLSVFSPISIGFADAPNITDPDQDSPERSDPRDRILLLNPLTQSVVMIEGSTAGINSLLRDLLSKDGPSPASKSSIEAMPSVETKEGDECVICLEEFGGENGKEMPCKHYFHGECVEKWLKINRSCPVCRYNMPVDEDDIYNHKNLFGGEEDERRREIWLRLSNQTLTNDADEVLSEMQGLV